MPDVTPGVVYDVQVLVDALVGPPSDFPLARAISPDSPNPAADCLSAAFDDDGFRLFSSPYVLTEAARVLEQLGLADDLVEAYVHEVVRIVSKGGGHIIDPPRSLFFVDHRGDPRVLDLLVAADALMLVTGDPDLPGIRAWNGRIVLRPRDFAMRAVRVAHLH